MRVLVLGGSGMLGHKVVQVLGKSMDVFALIRNSVGVSPQDLQVDSSRVIVSRFWARPDVAKGLLDALRPDVVVNCAGVVKQSSRIGRHSVMMAANSELPRNMQWLASEVGAKFIQVSTDCVFSGRRGQYSEDDEPDADDAYGRSKILGEALAADSLVLRTSIIGEEISSNHGLVEWFLHQRGPVPGYSNAYFSGTTTLAFAQVLKSLIVDFPDLCGQYHVASQRVSKLELLHRLRDAYGLATEIVPVPEPRLDRSLSAKKLHLSTGIHLPGWPIAVENLVTDPLRIPRVRIRS